MEGWKNAIRRRGGGVLQGWGAGKGGIGRRGGGGEVEGRISKEGVGIKMDSSGAGRGRAGAGGRRETAGKGISAAGG